MCVPQTCIHAQAHWNRGELVCMQVYGVYIFNTQNIGNACLLAYLKAKILEEWFGWIFFDDEKTYDSSHQ